MRKQVSRDMQQANGVAHSASGMSWEKQSCFINGQFIATARLETLTFWPGVSVQHSVVLQLPCDPPVRETQI